MKILQFTIICFLSAHCWSQDQPRNIELNLAGTTEVVKNNGYNAKEVEYFDKSGNHIYTISYDSQGNLEDTPFGIAIIEMQYDKSGNLIRQSYFDQNKKSFRTEMAGPATVTYKYDKKGNRVETAYLDVFDKPLKNGIAFVEAKYDRKNNVVEKRHLDENRQLSGKVCIFKYYYDKNGRKIKEEKYNKQENIVKVEEGHKFSILRTKYDDEDRIVEESYYNELDELVDGTARIVYDYSKKPDTKLPAFLKDPDPKWVEQTYYSKDGTEIKRDFQYLPKKK